jgi:hypothetical protein
MAGSESNPASSDPFDSVLELEDKLVLAGYEAGAHVVANLSTECHGLTGAIFDCLSGVSHGQATGEEAGREVGYEKGLQLGRELGEYRGRVSVLRVYFEQHPELATDRHARMTLHRSTH